MPTEDLTTICFNNCITNLALAFNRNHGCITRSRFMAICKEHKVVWKAAQAYFERADKCFSIHRAKPRRTLPGDVFNYEVKP